MDRRTLLRAVGAGSLAATGLSGTGGATAGSDRRREVRPDRLSASDWEWESVTDGDASTAVIDQYNLDLQVFKCSYAELSANFGSMTGAVRLVFDYETESDQWYEQPGLAIYQNDDEVFSTGFPNQVGGIVEGSTEVISGVDGDTTISFYIEPSQYCGNPDHANTYLRIRNMFMLIGVVPGSEDLEPRVNHVERSR